MENNFKGTKEKVYALQFGSVIFIQDGDFYEANNILDIEDVGLEKVLYNAQLIVDAFEIRQQINFDLPELLERYNKAVELLGNANQKIDLLCRILKGKNYDDKALFEVVESLINGNKQFLKTL